MGVMRRQRMLLKWHADVKKKKKKTKRKNKTQQALIYAHSEMDKSSRYIFLTKNCF
jgi:hypothetical protein